MNPGYVFLLVWFAVVLGHALGCHRRPITRRHHFTNALVYLAHSRPPDEAIVEPDWNKLTCKDQRI